MDQVDDIVRQAQAGNQHAFRQLFEQYQGRVYALCLRLSANVPLAEEATQEVFTHVWQKLHYFKFQSQFSTWLHSVAANVTVSYMRKQKNWLQRVTNFEDRGLIEEAGEALDGLDGLDKLILKLPERARMVFVLCAVEGYRHEEVAEILNMSPGTSKAQYHRAKKLLQQWWEHE